MIAQYLCEQVCLGGHFPKSGCAVEVRMQENRAVNEKYPAGDDRILQCLGCKNFSFDLSWLRLQIYISDFIISES